MSDESCYTEVYQVTIREESSQDTVECTRVERRTSNDDMLIGLGGVLSGALLGVHDCWITSMRALASAIEGVNEGHEGCPYEDDGDPEIAALCKMIDAAYVASEEVYKKRARNSQ